MAIRITGMYSGLDTESIISELASAQSVKVNSLKKAQIKYSWKQDAWKALNTKIYSFYTNTLDNMRWQASYLKKATKVSNSDVVSVVTGSKAVNGTQDLQVEKLAKQGFLTGANLSEANGGKKFTANTKLSELGIEAEGKFGVTINGKNTEITVNGSTTISGLVKQLESAGLNASFDEKSQRFFISSKDSGAAANFNLVGSNDNGMKALSSLGLLTETDLKSGAYKTWADYKNSDGTYTDAYKKALDAEILKRAKAYKAQNDSLTEENEKLKENNKKLQEQIDELTDQRDNNTALTQGDKDAIDEKLKDLQKQIDKNDKTIGTNDETIEANAKYFKVDKDGVVSGTTDADVAADENSLTSVVTAEFEEKIQNAKKVLADLDKTNPESANYDEDYKSAYKISADATKIEGQDAEITLNGAKFKSDTNVFEINGLTMTVQKETKGETVTLSTGEDTDAIYDMIKNFFTEYNKLINEMDSLYNAESSKGYDPLLSEEKAELADSEIEEWEKKIKDSVLRRDSTLGTIKDAMKSIMLQGATVNGKKMYLSDFGINTLGYFNAGDNEKSAYHIDGDQDDSNTKNEEDKLRAMIASDPDSVISFFTQLSNNLHDDLMNKMSATKLSSALTVYNDKEMKEEYDAYTEKISKQETKLNDLMDKWYKKFSSMETALSKLESKNNAVASMFGG